MAASPDETLAARVLPAPLLASIRHVFVGGAPGIGLVGGTALAGFYAGHRRSDDMDLFTGDHTAQAMTVAAIKDLKRLGAVLSDERASPAFFHVLIELDDHQFTAQAVLDAHLHQVGQFHTVPTGIRVASISTLRKMKIATLVSRCSEKDLYDLLWLKEQGDWPQVPGLVAQGQEIDASVHAESILISLTMATLRSTSCGFATELGHTAEAVLARVDGFRAELQQLLLAHLEVGGSPPSAMAPLIRKLRRSRA